MDLDIAVSCIVFALIRPREPHGGIGLLERPRERELAPNYRDFRPKHTALAQDLVIAPEFVSSLHHGPAHMNLYPQHLVVPS
jgi:hypothetical protein